jgi:hypothetical protein
LPLNRPLRLRGSVEVQLYSFFNLGARWWWVVNAMPRPVHPRERDPVPSVQEAGWAPGPVWTDAEILACTGIRSTDRPARTESLYRIPYTGVFLPLYLSYLKGFPKLACSLTQNMTGSGISPPPPLPQNFGKAVYIRTVSV